ncbi:hypothetical protein ATJ93_0356 [Halopiger aswanensis]|uniref:Uncharacterized protein n=1 Tax=Halopiger aswanensis TaxID=148449 RepID=A0A419WPF6_9EURY|nr:hypothetical protein ATJ93_0356 [Halopiger aswanensis]
MTVTGSHILFSVLLLKDELTTLYDTDNKYLLSGTITVIEQCTI